MDPVDARLAAYDTMRRLGATLLIDDIDDVSDGVINTDSPWGVPAPHHWTLGAALLAMGVAAEHDARERLGGPVAAQDRAGDQPSRTLDYEDVRRNQQLYLEGGGSPSVEEALEDLDAAFTSPSEAD